jgi:hypothetical protein
VVRTHLRPRRFPQLDGLLKALIEDLVNHSREPPVHVHDERRRAQPGVPSRSASTVRPGSVQDPPTWTGSANEGIVHAERRYGGSGRLNSRPPIPAHADERTSSTSDTIYKMSHISSEPRDYRSNKLPAYLRCLYPGWSADISRSIPSGEMPSRRSSHCTSRRARGTSLGSEPGNRIGIIRTFDLLAIA